MSSAIADACRDHHRTYGIYSTCPWDCGAGEIVDWTFDADEEALRELEAQGRRGIRCGNCKTRHATVATVKFCYAVTRDRQTFQRREAAIEEALAEAGECEHGLSAALCSGPGHYPPDRYDD